MSRPRVIGFGGFPTAGKDAAADILSQEYQYEAMAFSDPLNDALKRLNPIIDTDTGERYASAVATIGYTETKAMYPEARRLLRYFGTEVCKPLFGEDVWVNNMNTRLLLAKLTGKSVAITGVRAQNEIGLIKTHDGITIWIDRPGIEPSTHSSDTTLDPSMFDYQIVNDGTLSDLRDKVIAAVNDEGDASELVSA